MFKPELLLPAGNPEAFFAAIEGGADSVYLGLRDFNARNRADNFTRSQLLAILKEAHKQNKKVYLTLNTLVKNNELFKILDILHFIEKAKFDAVIIQDLGILYLLRKFFPQVNLHASTQMGFHNSSGTLVAKEIGFERIILARELTLPELTKIQKKSRIELEVFVHGALCYSFSGMCLFSSFLGGMSANRGKCRQPCRRTFLSGEHTKYLFSLKDLQSIELLPELKRLNISSVKLEGRMKSAEYVHRVARAYRMAIDDEQKIPEAKKLLENDMGREKTGYFLNGKINSAITENAYTGNLIGIIETSEQQHFTFRTDHPLHLQDRIRIQPKTGRDSQAIKIKEMMLDGIHTKKVKSGEKVTILSDRLQAEPGDKVFLIGLAQPSFPGKLRSQKPPARLSSKKIKHILAKIGSRKQLNNIQIFLRIDKLKWLRKVYFESFSYLILKLPKDEWKRLNIQKPFLQNNLSKLIVQLPKFIAEQDIHFYRNLLKNYAQIGVTNFMISHISQLEILPRKAKQWLYASENIYCLNDAAIQFLKEADISSYVYPLETDKDNLFQGKDRKGIVPLYFHPELFYSRMPVKLPDNNDRLQDRDHTYKKFVRSGITTIVPELPASFLQYKDELFKQGFRRFLIDLSYEKPSQNTFNRLIKKFHNSQAEQPAFVFNFKLGLT